MNDDDEYLNQVEEACNQLARWAKEGKKLPGYIMHRGKPYMAHLLRLPVNDDMGTDYSERFLPLLKAAMPDLPRQLTGPYGWAVLQVLIIRYNEREGVDDTTNPTNSSVANIP